MSTAAPARRLTAAHTATSLHVADLRPGNLFQTIADPTRILAPLTSSHSDVSEVANTWCVVIHSQRPTDVVGQLMSVNKGDAIQLVAAVNPYPKFMVVAP